ncbi:peptidase [Aliivibrio fischeri]|uniref:CBASS system CD-NTase/cGAS isopeptidase Cap3 n=1 Tax=Aliivibrio fischeri TaxID=668 RepID=UPI00035FCF32|nr:Mov34/MPN/PAD-1 family protein [Aliivibrio fischeri]MUK60727.1 peptidase [Aliivibrio fischeri]MUL20767.1 peptidase [Aliivibrio fischeri]MUL24542.1 peptidase [Aliivibrio fischeri]OEE28002.1 peptidase [Aliivibrio fischeri ZF-211]
MEFEKELTYQDSNGHLVVLTEHVLAVLEKYRQTRRQDNEAAGILLGEKRGQHIVITDLSEPGKGDLRKRNLVDRRGKHHQQKVDDCFQLSGGTVNYLGEWHTHPEDFPKPSQKDRTSWSVHLKGGTPKIVLIVGIKDFWIEKMNGTSSFKLSFCQ